ncbi:MAG TPA: hypothetical protein VLA24_17855 [Pseudomonadales bacterium]|nr:hypothetical protein [Pseudomonadales bacterium]
MAERKRTAAQRLIDLAFVERLHLRGKNADEIAIELSAIRPYNLSRQQVGYDIRAVSEIWKAEAIALIDEAKSRTLADLKELQGEFWSAWESSKEERTKARQEVGGKKDGQPVVTKSSMEKEQRDGNPAFLQGVLSCIDRRCKILGIDAPVKNEVDNRGEIIIKVIYDDTDIDTAATQAATVAK